MRMHDVTFEISDLDFIRFLVIFQRGYIYMSIFILSIGSSSLILKTVCMDILVKI